MIDNKITLDLGQLTGKLFFFGGVYSNIQALEACKAWADDNSFEPDHIFCTGDIGGYCANPKECFDLIKDWQIHSIAGNIELQLRNNEDDCGCDFSVDGRCDLFSKTWYSYLTQHTDETTREWLQTLPHHITFKFGNQKFVIVHGSWFKTSEFIFESTAWQIKKENFEATGADIIIAGHCGLPFMNKNEDLTWVNPGVIGMPANDGSRNVWFATAEVVDGVIDLLFHQLHYDYKHAKQSMIENQLPISYANTLETGIWDNCEILPEEETRKQGLKILL